LCAFLWDLFFFFFFSSRRRHTRSKRDWSSDVCSSDLVYLSVDRASCFQRLFRIIDDFPVFLLCIRHPDPGKPSDISILPSAFRKEGGTDRKSTRLNSSHVSISYAVFCLKKKKQQ